MHRSGNGFRVLQVIKGLDIGGINGGAERFSIDLTRALQSLNVDVSICVFFDVNSPTAALWEKRLSEEGIHFFYLTEWLGNDRFNVYFESLRLLRRQVRLNPFDVVHSHFQLGSIAALDLKFNSLSKAALRTAHNLPAREWSGGLYGHLRYAALSKWIYPVFLDVEVGVSQAIVNKLAHHPGARLSRKAPLLIYNAIQVDRHRWTKPRDPSLAPIIGVVGRLATQKGHRFLLDATVELIKEFPDLKVWIIGEGELRKELEDYSEGVGLNNIVHFWGNRQDVLDLVTQMNLFVLPSLWEGLPTVILESMACGTPVIATNIMGTTELISHGQTGWLVQPADSSQLASQIRMALLDPQACEKVRLQAFQSLDRFSIDSIASQYLDLYGRLV